MNPDTYHARVRTRGSDAGRLHAPQLVLELTDLVPQPGRHLELQLGRGHVHLLGELLDQLDQVVASRATALAGQVLAHPGTGGPGRGASPGRQSRYRRLAPALLPPGTPDELVGVGVLADQLVQDVGDLLAQRLRVDAVLGVVGDLLFPAASGLLDRVLHGRGDLVRVHDDL